MKRRRPRAAALAGNAPHFIVVTGLSGAGKSQAIRALEDAGYFCVDNLPIALIPTFADLALGSDGHRRAAVVVDVRGGVGLSRFPSVYRRLKRRKELRAALVFLEADDAMLQRRFSETRRPHPLAPDRSAAEGIREERRRLEPMRRLADRIIDTGKLNVHDLRRIMLDLGTGGDSAAPLTINVLSFGFKSGVPTEADLMFDVRFLPNPHFVAGLRQFSGRNPRVARYVLRAPAARRFLRLTAALLRFLVPQYVAEGKHYLTIAIGCTGGRHRSIVIAESLARRLRSLKGVELRVRHRDVAEGD